MFTPYATNKDADQPAHPRSLISAFVVHCLDSRIIKVLSISKLLRLVKASVSQQAGLSLTWSQVPSTGFLVHGSILLTLLHCKTQTKIIPTVHPLTINGVFRLAKIEESTSHNLSRSTTKPTHLA